MATSEARGGRRIRVEYDALIADNSWRAVLSYARMRGYAAATASDGDAVRWLLIMEGRAAIRDASEWAAERDALAQSLPPGDARGEGS